MKLLIFAAGFACAGLFLGQDETRVHPDTQAAFAIEELVEQATQSQRAWVPFLDRPTLNCGLYRLPAGAQDGQDPHVLDEVYYVVEGKARLRAGSEEFDAKAGSIFFVERKIEHRFVDIEEDLVVLVFFSKLVPEDED
jgi:quercetin dioxygenase-like cupin family protein